jgi:hypothetical protein
MIWLAAWSAAVLVICLAWHLLHGWPECTILRHATFEDAEAYRASFDSGSDVSAWRWTSYRCGKCGSFHVGLVRK